MARKWLSGSLMALLAMGAAASLAACANPLADKPQLMRFALRHPIVAQAVGVESDKATNITSDAVRISRGLGLIDSAEMDGRGTQVNAIRHTLWQALITARFNAQLAAAVGYANEEAPERYDNQPDSRLWVSAIEADTRCDLGNNQIGRMIGAAHPGERNAQVLARAVLEHYREHGLWQISESTPQGFRASLVKLPEGDFEEAMKRLNAMNADGFAR